MLGKIKEKSLGLPWMFEGRQDLPTY
jgi:hypothetical protein